MEEMQCKAMKDRANHIMDVAREVAELETKDKRATSIAVTHLQTAAMWLRAGAYGTVGRID